MDQSAKPTEMLLRGIRQAITTGEKVTVSLREASTITGSGSGIGGRLYADDAFAAARYANPFRQSARQITVDGSDAMFVAKVGNAASSSNPWGYTPSYNAGNEATTIWQLPVRVLSASVPVRTAVLSDVNGLDASLVEDLLLEFSSLEASAMAINNDQSGSTTTTTGGTSGLRGLGTYAGGASAAFGTSGSAITNGVHTIATVAQGTASVAYDDIVNVANALPAQYWAMPGTAWHVHPTLIQSLRKLKANGLPVFLETGDADAAPCGFMMGWPVIPNPYLATPATGSASLYLANWPRFMTIGDYPEVSIQMMEQTAPGFVTIWGEKRMVSTVRDVFAGVRMTS